MNSLRRRVNVRWNIKHMIRQLKTGTINIENPGFKIDIPMRIERSPTDILKALESTIIPSRDIPEYQYIDDPLLLPMSASQQCLYSLAQESGKRAARLIMNEHSDLFQSKLSDPLIQDYIAPIKYKDKSEVSLEILMKLMEIGSYKDAFEVYNLLEGDVPIKVKQAILEMLCYFNGKPKNLTDKYPNKYKYRRDIPLNKNEWSNDPAIISLFEELKNDKDAAAMAYNAMICGTAKYFAVAKTSELYEECLAKDLFVTAKAYNNIITTVHIAKINIKEAFTSIKQILNNMEKSKIPYTVETLNAVLKNFLTVKDLSHLRSFSKYFLQKFESFNVQPNFETFYYLLRIEYSNKNYQNNDVNTLNYIKEKMNTEKFTIQSSTDVKFFSSYMEVMQKNHLNPLFAHELHDFAEKNKYLYMQSKYEMDNYFDNYFILELNNSSLEDFAQFYNRFVPKNYIPNYFIMELIFERFLMEPKNNMKKELFLKFVNDITLYNKNKTYHLIHIILEIIYKRNLYENDLNTNDVLANSVSELWTRFMKVRREVKKPLNITNYITMIMLMLRSNKFDQAQDILLKLINNPGNMIGVLNEDNLKLLCKEFIARKQTNSALDFLQYADENTKLNLETFITDVQSNLSLDPEQDLKLKFMLEKHKNKSKMESK